MLVGWFVRERERLSDAVRAALLEKAGIETDREPWLLRIFDAPDRLLGDRFTLLELREAVLGQPLLRDTFNRRVVEHLTEVTVRGETLQRSWGGRPAKVYRHKAQRSLTSSEVRRPCCHGRSGE